MKKVKKMKVAVITGTRAEYGLLKLILSKIRDSSKLELKLIVTGTHLCSAFGNTYKDIEADGFEISYKVDILLGSDSPAAIAKSMGLCTTSFAQVFQQMQPDIVLFLGDRFELLSAASAALPFNILLAHIAGGEVTEGAMDDQIRHALTKLSHLHFPCSDDYAENLKKMCEEPWRIHNAGHPCLELIRHTKLISKKELFRKYNLNPSKKLFLVTLHSTTLNSMATEKSEAKAFFNVLKKYSNANIIITHPNADTNGHLILNEINEIKKLQNVHSIPNLGSLNYLSLMKVCDLVIGNSSSGLVEGPFFKVPVINYGERQKGRLKASNIIDAKPNEKDFNMAIEMALYNANYRNALKKTRSIYGDGNTSDIIVKVLESTEKNELLLKKKFIR